MEEAHACSFNSPGISGNGSFRAFMASLDRVIPPDEAVPFKGRTFADWERQALLLQRSVARLAGPRRHPSAPVATGRAENGKGDITQMY
jgi:hypothetical protein